MSARNAPLLTTLVLLLFLASAAAAQGPAPQPRRTQQQIAEAVAQLAPRYQQWLRSVIGLMTVDELGFFLDLGADYRRDAFIEAFWKPRDPDRRTAENELRDRWEEYGKSAGAFPYGDPRFLLYLLNGPPGGWTLPDGRPAARCFSAGRELEIWFYDGSERTEKRFLVIFYRRSSGTAYQAYLPGDSIDPIQRSGGLPSRSIQALCADELLRYSVREIYRLGNYPNLLEEVLTPPMPSMEWLSNFSASVTELPEGAETFDVAFELGFPARKQSRTAVQAVLRVPRESAPGRRFDGELFHDFLLIGEVLKDGRLFESFRYRFEGPTPEAAVEIPLGFTRYLRPGAVTLRILLEDIYASRYAQVIREIEVPSPEGLAAEASAAAAPKRASGPTLRLYPPSGDVHVGLVRFRAQAGGGIDKVTFFLDDRSLLSKRRPPYSAEIDLGKAAEPHRVRVVGYQDDREVATDQIWLNQGAKRFVAHLVEPRAGGIYPGSLTARVEVTTPDGKPPERVELFLNDEPVKTLREPPYVEGVRLAGSEVAVVRAVAYLADGTSTEDAVLVNSTPFTETVEVSLVEVPTLVTGGDGKPIAGLVSERFRVFEGDVEQPIERFEETRDAPLNVALLVDRSASMGPHMARVAEAGTAFAHAALASPEDRVAVFSFADQLTVDTTFTVATAQLERSLAGLVAHGGTAFYDSLAQALNNFADGAGQSALVVFTDGQDESSRLTYDEARETLRRAGVVLYAVALAEAFPEKKERRTLEDLAEETGGRAYFLAGLAELDAVYAEVLAELRTRYLIAYRPAAGGDEYRELRVEVDVKGARVRARQGYYP